MHPYRGELLVVEPGPAQPCFVQLKPQRLDEVQLAPGIRAQPDNIAGVGWNFGFVE